MNIYSLKKTCFFHASASALAMILSGLACAVMAEDMILTKTQQRFTGQVLSANTNGVAIKCTDGQQFQIPRELIVELTVAQPALIEKGIQAYERGNMREAVASLGRAITQFEAMDTDWAAKAVLYYARASLAVKDYPTAGKMFNAFLAWYPDSTDIADAEVGLVEIDMHQDKHESALDKFLEMAEQYDNQVKPSAAGIRQAATIYMGIGQCYEKIDKKQKALQAYLTVIALYPDKMIIDKALFNAGLLYVALDKPDNANSLFGELISEYPGSALAKDAIKEQSAIRARHAEIKASKEKDSGK